jgi:hypothetical protein
MAARSQVVGWGVLILIAACARSATTRDPIEGIPIARQRTISRADLGFRWPLSVGVGTLACDDAGTVLFRSQGTTYLLRGRRAGTHDVEALRIPEPAPPPSHPLKRLKQAEREEAFRQLASCESNAPDQPGCRRAAVQRLGLSDAEGEQISVEGHERRWPPLSRAPMSLDPLIEAGRALCQSSAGR